MFVRKWIGEQVEIRERDRLLAHLFSANRNIFEAKWYTTDVKRIERLKKIEQLILTETNIVMLDDKIEGMTKCQEQDLEKQDVVNPNVK